MLHACVRKFDVNDAVQIFLGTKHCLKVNFQYYNKDLYERAKRYFQEQVPHPTLFFATKNVDK
jgi:hypothetical protein